MNRPTKQLFTQLSPKRKPDSVYGNNKRVETILEEDEFDVKIKNDPKKAKLIRELDKLMSDFTTLAKTSLTQIENKFASKSYFEINLYFDDKLIQIMRLKLVIEPQFQKSIQTHTITDLKYLILKILWIDDQMKRVVKFSLSMGNIDQAGTEINTNNQIIINAKKELADKLLQEYEALYK